MARHLHIVAFDVPSPPDYGGVIDIYHKLKALAEAGVRVHLHCFAYGRAESTELKEYCQEVYYYERNMNRSLLTHPLPFIVVSRQSTALYNRLMADDHPILFEGHHCCYYLDHPSLADRPRYVRTHNVESDYYQGLADRTSSFIKKWYYRLEARKLRRYESTLIGATALFCISAKDVAHYSALHSSVTLLPPFHGAEPIPHEEDKGDYALYHGNLSVAENIEAVTWLVKEVFPIEGKRLIIYGKGCPAKLARMIEDTAGVELRSRGDLTELAVRARMHLLPTFQATGMKLKLLFSLRTGGHLLVTPDMVQSTGLESLCAVVDGPEAMRTAVMARWHEPYTADDHNKRYARLDELYSDKAQAKTLIDVIFG